MQNAVGNVMSDADGMKEIWKKYIKKKKNYGHDTNMSGMVKRLVPKLWGCCLIAEEVSHGKYQLVSYQGR